MIILDENILDGQRLLLEAWGLPASQIGFNLGHKGLKDENVVVLLREQRNPTFFTRDGGFFHRDLRSRSYCLVVMNVGQNEVAGFIRRFLRHPSFDTWAKRAGRVVRISRAGLAVWRQRAQAEVHMSWT